MLGAAQVVVGHIVGEVVGLVEGRLHPGGGPVAEVGQGHRHRHVDRGQQPQEDDREEATDAEHWKEALKLS